MRIKPVSELFIQEEGEINSLAMHESSMGLFASLMHNFTENQATRPGEISQKMFTIMGIPILHNKYMPYGYVIACDKDGDALIIYELIERKRQ